MDFFTKIEATIADSKNLVANFASLKSRLISIACIKSDVEDLINEYGIEGSMKAYKDGIRQEEALVKKAHSYIGIFKSQGKCCIFQLVERAELNNKMVKILEDIKELEKISNEIRKNIIALLPAMVISFNMNVKALFVCAAKECISFATK